jgi:hypothetical protein
MIHDFAPKDGDYKTLTAEPTMKAVDLMPPAYRQLVNEFGYVDVYRAWRRGYTPQAIKSSAHNGLFVLK